MKPLKMTKETTKKLVEAFLAKYAKEIESGSFTMENSVRAPEKVNVIYTPLAYLKMQALVDFFKTEVGWYGLVERLNEKTFRVYDVKVCKQYVSGGKVDTEDEELEAFKDSLSDEEINHMYFQAHSHVDFATTASGTDMQNQADMVRNMGKKGYLIFQIWNKKGDVNTYLYDIENNMFYDRNDVELSIEGVGGWLDEVSSLVEERKVYPYQFEKKGKKKKNEEPYYGGYYNGYWQGGEWE